MVNEDLRPPVVEILEQAFIQALIRGRMSCWMLDEGMKWHAQQTPRVGMSLVQKCHD